MSRVSTRFRPQCHVEFVLGADWLLCHGHKYSLDYLLFSIWPIDICSVMYVIRGTHMPRRSKPRLEDPKVVALRSSGTLHPHPESIHDEAFSTDEFFDRRDRLQVKYEMLRRHRVERRPVTEVAVTFGASRQAFYTTARAFGAQGIAGLLPRSRGPKRAHKCRDEILDFVERWRAEQVDPGETAAQVVARRFGITIHPRSLDRALARRKKKLRAQGNAPS